MPVSPIPPIVAHHSSGSDSGVSSCDRAVGHQHRHRPQVVAERTVDVVVLAVDVAGDRPAERHEAGAGRDRHEEALRHQMAQQVVEADAGVGRHEPARGVEPDRRRPVVRGARPCHRRSAPRRRTSGRDPRTSAPRGASGRDGLGQRIVVDVDHVGAAGGGSSPARQRRRMRPFTVRRYRSRRSVRATPAAVAADPSASPCRVRATAPP